MKSLLWAFGWLIRELVPVGSQWGQNNKTVEESVLRWHFHFTQDVLTPQLHSMQSNRGIWSSQFSNVLALGTTWKGLKMQMPAPRDSLLE